MVSPLTSICRFCLFDDVQDESRPIANLFSSFDHLPVLKHVQNFLRIDLSPKDSIPPNACQLCIEKIKYVGDFLETCQNAKKQLALIFGGPSNTIVKDKSGSSSASFKFPNGSNSSSESSLESRKILKPSKTRRNIGIGSGNKKIRDSIKLPRPKFRATQSETNFNCKKRKKLTKNTTELKRRKCITKDRHKCPKCEKKFPDKIKLIMHVQTHKIPCQICQKPIYPKRLESHLLKHANHFQKRLESVSKQKLKVSCEICMKSFKSEGYLNRHQVKQHKNSTARKNDQIKIKIKKTVKERKTINCDACGEAFLSRGKLTAHQILHNDEQNSDEAQICDVNTQNLDQVSNSGQNDLPKEHNFISTQ